MGYFLFRRQGHTGLVSGFFMLLCFASALAAEGIPLNRATFTDVVNDVAVLKASTNARIPVKKDDQVSAPDLVRTGEKSRAELKAPDETLTRIGANTVLSFKQDGRGINLEQGSVLFHSPTGKGGGTIQTAAVTAAVTGTTIIVVCTKNGGFKLLVLEGKGKATLPGGHSVNVGAGQLVFVLAGAKGFSPVFNYQLMNQTQKSGLVHGFNGKLASQDKIDHAIDQQNDQILNGKMVVTDLLVSDGDATTGGVPVISQDTLGSQFGNSAFLAALLAAFNKDVILTGSALPQDQIFGVQFFAAGEAFLGVHDTSHNNQQPNDLALVARDITVQTSLLNLSPYAAIPHFEFASNGTITLPASLTIATLGPSRVGFFGKDKLNTGSITYNGGGLDLSGGQLNIAPGSTIAGNSPNGSNDGVDLQSYSNLNLTNVNVLNLNPTGFVGVETEGNLTMNGGIVSGSTSTMSGGIELRSGLDMNITTATFSSAYQEFDAGGSMTMSGPMFIGTTNYTTQFYAAGSMTMSNPTFIGSPGYIRMDATKIILNNVNFPTSANVDLFTTTGNWSTINPVPGGVYFNNCTYGTIISGSGTAGVVATAGGNQLQSLHH